MKLVKIDGLWVQPEMVVAVVPNQDAPETKSFFIYSSASMYFGVDVNADEVAALLMGGDAAQKKLMSEEEQKAAWEKEKQEWETEMQKTLAYYRKKYGKD